MGDTIAGRKPVKIPLEIAFHPVGLQKSANGKMNLMVTTTLPFLDKHNVINTYNNPNTLGDLIIGPLVDLRAILLKDVKDAVNGTQKPCTGQSAPTPLVKSSYSIPLDQIIRFNHFGIQLKNIAITPNRGLLFTADLKN